MILFNSCESQGKRRAPELHAALSASGFRAVFKFLKDYDSDVTFNDSLDFPDGAAELNQIISSFVQESNFDLEKFSPQHHTTKNFGADNMTFSNDVKTQIKNIPPEELAARGVIVPARTKANGKLTYICPECGNGEGDSGDGIAFEYKDGAWLAKCFKCGKGFDNFILLALHYHLDPRADFPEICRRAAADFGLSADNDAPPKFAPKVNDTAALAQDSKELELIQTDIAAAANNLDKLPLDARRGFLIAVICRNGSRLKAALQALFKLLRPA